MDTTEIIKNALDWADKRLELADQKLTKEQRNYITFALRQNLVNILPIQNVSVSSYFKVTFRYDKSKEGRSVWIKEEKVFDAKSAEELDSKIKKYISEGINSLTNRKYYMKYDKIEKL